MHENEEIQEKGFQDSDITITIGKKIRNLETRIKNMALKHQNDLYKVREENSKNVSKLSIYEEYLKEFHPTILQQIQTKLKESEDNHDGFDFMSDSSSSNGNQRAKISKDDSLAMPVFSQLQEVRLEAIKLCDKLKSTNKNLQ